MSESLRILILEDRSADAELIHFELEEAELTFVSKVVTTEEEYTEAIQDFCPDLILSDYDLPTYNGALALAEARKRCPDTPFILVSGAVTEDRAIEILTRGAKDYVLKWRLQQRLGPAVKRALAEADELRARKKAEERLREAHRNLESQVAERTADLQKEIEQRYRAEQSLLRYTERIELLSYTAGRLLASDNPQRVVEELCLRVMAFLDCDAFFNFLLDGAAGRLHLNACAGIPRETMREIEWLDYGVAVCGCAARDACRIVAEDIPGTPDVRTELVRSFGIKAYACHPLMEQNRVLGTLSFGTRSRTTFSKDDLDMMKAVADQVAIAISRVRARDAMRESGARFQSVLDNSRDVIYRLNVQTGCYEYISPSAETVVGFSPAELMAQDSRTAMTMIHPDDMPAMRAALARLEETGQEEVEYRQRTRKGDYRRISNHMSLIKDAAGRPLYRDGNIRDITKRMRAEEELGLAYRRLQTVFDHRIGGIGIVVATAEGDVLQANDYYLGILGCSRDELLNGKMKWSDFTPPEWRPADEKALAQLRRQGICEATEKEYARRDGSRVPVHIAAAMLPGEGKEILAFVLDLTRHKQAEEKLRRYESLADRHREVILCIDLDGGRILQANDAATGVYGYSRAQLLSMSVHDLRASEGAGLTAAQMARAFHQGLLLEEVHRRQDGSTFPAEVSTQGADVGGRRILISAIREITERKRMGEGTQATAKE